MPEPDFLLSSYQRMLRTALANGYRFVTYGEIGKESSKLSCILRHDVDAELLGCAPMLAVERAAVVQATYFLMTRSTAYNLFCVESRRMVERILSEGHRIGLHFMGELCEGDTVEQIAGKVHIEVDWLEREFATRIEAVSFHQPSKAILDGALVIRGLVNTYNKAQTNPYFYVSDTNMQWRHEHPEEIFARQLHPRLQLLIHPIWWTSEAMPLEQKWLAVLRNNDASVVAHWQARERTLAGVRLEDYLAHAGSRASRDG